MSVRGACCSPRNPIGDAVAVASGVVAAGLICTASCPLLPPPDVPAAAAAAGDFADAAAATAVAAKDNEVELTFRRRSRARFVGAGAAPIKAKDGTRSAWPLLLLPSLVSLSAALLPSPSPPPSPFGTSSTPTSFCPSDSSSAASGRAACVSAVAAAAGRGAPSAAFPFQHVLAVSAVFLSWLVAAERASLLRSRSRAPSAVSTATVVTASCAVRF